MTLRVTFTEKPKNLTYTPSGNMILWAVVEAVGRYGNTYSRQHGSVVEAVGRYSLSEVE